MNGTEANQPIVVSFPGKRRLLLWSCTVLTAVAVLGTGALFPALDVVQALQLDLSTAMVLMLFFLALVCEYIDSSLGMGYGTTLGPVLLLSGFDPLHIVPAILMSEFVTGLGASIMHHRDGNIDLFRDRQARSTAFLLSVLSVGGTIAAACIAVQIPKHYLKLAMSVIILAAGLITLLTIRRRMRFSRSRMTALGLVAAFNKGMSGGGYGPIVTSGQMIAGLSPKKAVAITSLAESVTCMSGLCAYMLVYGAFNWSLVVPLTAGAVMSVPIATLTVRLFKEKTLRVVIGIVTCGLGLLALIRIVA